MLYSDTLFSKLKDCEDLEHLILLCKGSHPESIDLHSLKKLRFLAGAYNTEFIWLPPNLDTFVINEISWDCVISFYDPKTEYDSTEKVNKILGRFQAVTFPFNKGTKSLKERMRFLNGLKITSVEIYVQNSSWYKGNFNDLISTGFDPSGTRTICSNFWDRRI